MKLFSKRRISGSLRGDIAMFTLLALLSIFMIFPFYFTIVQSIKPMEELFVFPPKLYAQSPTFENFTELFKVAGNLWVPFSRYVFNSLFVTIVVTVANIFCASSAAYVLAKVKMPGQKLLNQVIVLSLLFTSAVTGIMQYMVMAVLGMIDSYFALILPAVATPMGLFLMKQFMGQVPDSLIEAARIDGAGHFRTCWQVVMPNVKPAWLTLIVFSFQGAWNITGQNFVYNESLKTLPTVMSQITASGLARQGISFAGAVIMMLPPLIVFIATQSNVMETMAHSGIKE